MYYLYNYKIVKILNSKLVNYHEMVTKIISNFILPYRFFTNFTNFFEIFFIIKKSLAKNELVLEADLYIMVMVTII
jgi:hypothetical protein